jgi:predicted Zn-ribbon and HTH transcriptional regulator
VHTLKKLLIFAKVHRAESVIVHGKHLFLKECKKCGMDFYGVEKQSRCDECVGTRKKRAS